MINIGQRRVITLEDDALMIQSLSFRKVVDWHRGFISKFGQRWYLGIFHVVFKRIYFISIFNVQLLVIEIHFTCPSLAMLVQNIHFYCYSI